MKVNAPGERGLLKQQPHARGFHVVGEPKTNVYQIIMEQLVPKNNDGDRMLLVRDQMGHTKRLNWNTVIESL
jgi:hypothetical protein